MVTLGAYVGALLSCLSMYDRTGDHWLLSCANDSIKMLDSLEFPHALAHPRNIGCVTYTKCVLASG